MTPQEAAEVDQRIWLLWLHSEDKAVNRLMAQGVIAMQRGALDRALDRFDEIVERAPDFAEGWNKRATVLYMMGRHRDSVADVQQVLNLEPRHYGALSGLGMIPGRDRPGGGRTGMAAPRAGTQPLSRWDPASGGRAQRAPERQTNMTGLPAATLAQLEAAGVESGRPLLISDADEVLFRFVETFVGHIGERAIPSTGRLSA